MYAVSSWARGVAVHLTFGSALRCPALECDTASGDPGAVIGLQIFIGNAVPPWGPHFLEYFLELGIVKPRQQPESYRVRPALKVLEYLLPHVRTDHSQQTLQGISVEYRAHQSAVALAQMVSSVGHDQSKGRRFG
jgi:hypothetical protein